MPEDKKKPAKKAAARRAAPARKTTAKKTAAKKTAAKKTTTRRTAARKPAASRTATTRKPATRRKPAQTEQPEVEVQDLDADELGPAPSGAGPFIVGAPAAAGEADPEPVAVADGATADAVAVTDGTVPAEDAPPERYPEDIPVIIMSAVLAGSVFLPWYRLSSAFRETTVTASGWASGTWGPMILFLGLASLAVAVLRRANVRVGLPIADSHLHEGVGWAAIIGAVIKLRAVPKEQGIQMGWTWGIIVAIVAAFALAFLAGRMSGSMPFTTIPGWFRGRAGKIGLALLVVAVAGSAAFGVTQNVSPYQLATGSTAPNQSGNGANTNVLRDKFPNCAEGFPRPDDAKPREGVEQRGQSPCVFTYSSAETPADLLTFYKAELKKAGYTFTELPSRGDAAGFALTFTAPKCGSMSMQRAEGASESNVIVAVGGPCPQQSGSGTGSGSGASPSSSPS